MSKDFRILVVDDEAAQRIMLVGFLEKIGYDVSSSENGTQALEKIKKERFDLVLTDFRMPGLSGLETMHEINKINPEIPVVIMTAYGTIETAVQAMKEGAYYYLPKPVDLDELSHMIGNIKERQSLLTENRELKEKLKERYQLDQIIGESGTMQEVLSIVHRVSPTSATVLIRGESGTGKELIATAIHYNSPRSDKPFIKFNCAALPENLLESELFGHEKGAFTGAVDKRIGRFEAADKGTIFLDEIGDLSPALQIKLLRVLQEREFERVGSNKPIKVDVRVIAATNQNLEDLIKEKRFREDLYYRLNVVSIYIPPLRQRRDDIPFLIDHFLAKFADRSGKKISEMTREARDTLLKYDYPGNVRELENILERAVILSRESTISLEDLPLHMKEKDITASTISTEEKKLPDVVEDIEKAMILQALKKNEFIQTKAAEELGISERVLRYKLKKYNVSSP